MGEEELFKRGKITHLHCAKNDIAPIVFLVSHKEKIDYFNPFCEELRIVSQSNNFAVATGYYEGVLISVCTTGIGGPSTEIAVKELTVLGAKVLIRVGTTGAITPEISCSDLIINTGAMRLGGASNFYVPPEYPAVASFEVVASLLEACKEDGQVVHMGICTSAGSYYAGQGREIFGNRLNSRNDVIDRYRSYNILNMEMEIETIFTLASINGLLSGSILLATFNRITDEWLDEWEIHERKIVRIALQAALKINEKI